MKTYLFSYQFRGSKWSFEIMAKDAEEAEARVRELCNATLDGELIMSFPARTGWIARTAVHIRNFIADLFSLFRL